jgi:lysophospholipase L1-like esterase
MQEVLNTLIDKFGAVRGDIHVACPIYAKQPARHDLEQEYLAYVNTQLRANNGLGAGPDFFRYYRDNADALADQVHPNAVGYGMMAYMWLDAIHGHNAVCGA